MNYLTELEEEIMNRIIKHDNYDKNYKVGFNVALGQILLIVNKFALHENTGVKR